jgi:hypothetical protein
MYRCEILGKNSRLGEKLNRITALTRERTYTKWVKDEDTKQWSEVILPVKGFEIVKELSCSLEGYELWQSWTEVERDGYMRKHYPHFFNGTKV